jgi:hypothetical protein
MVGPLDPFSSTPEGAFCYFTHLFGGFQPYALFEQGFAIIYVHKEVDTLIEWPNYVLLFYKSFSIYELTKIPLIIFIPNLSFSLLERAYPNPDMCFCQPGHVWPLSLISG